MKATGNKSACQTVVYIALWLHIKHAMQRCLSSYRKATPTKILQDEYLWSKPIKISEHSEIWKSIYNPFSQQNLGEKGVLWCKLTLT